MEVSTAISLSRTLSLLSPISLTSSSIPYLQHVSLSRRCHLRYRRHTLSRSFCLPPAVPFSSSSRRQNEDEEAELVEIEDSELEEEYIEDDDSIDVESLEREAELVVREFSDSLSRQLTIGLSLFPFFHFTSYIYRESYAILKCVSVCVCKSPQLAVQPPQNRIIRKHDSYSN